MTKWLLLAGAIVSEVSGSLSLEGAIRHPWLYGVVAAGYLLSFWLFGLVLRAGMPVGVGYAIWGAIGVALTAVFSAVLFDERLTVLSIVGMAVVIGGVVLVNLSGGHGGSDSAPEDAS